MSSERTALIRAVCLNPDDDTPRLIFSDWCEDNGEPERAALIRRPEELFFVIRDTGMKWCYFKGPSISRAEGEIIHREMLPIEPHDGGSVKIRRGFIEKIEVPWPTFRDHADTLTASHPIREVTLTTMPRYVAHGNRYAMIASMDGGDWEYRWETTEGYAELCRMFKDWLASYWPRITFNLPPEPVMAENPFRHVFDTLQSSSNDFQRIIGEMQDNIIQQLAIPLQAFTEGVGRIAANEDVMNALRAYAELNPASSPRSDHEPTA
jgi:uncharacterized protein (TIGR02996 family)